MVQEARNNLTSNKRIAKNSVFMSIRMFIILIIQLYTTRVILAALGVEDYGIYNVVCGFVTMFTFLSTAMNNGIQRFYNFELGKNGEEGLRKVYNAVIRVQSVIALILAVIIEIAGLWYIQYKMVIPSVRLSIALWVFHSSVISLVLVMFQVPYSAVIVAKERMDFYAILSVANSALILLLSFCIKYSSFDRLLLYGWGLALIQLLILIAYKLYSRKITNSLQIDKSYDRSLLRSILGFSGWNVFGAFGGIMREQGTNMILNLFCGPVVNAARGIAAQVNGGFQGVVSNLNIAVRPQITQSYARGDIERTMNLTFSISKLSCFALYLFSYPIMLELDYVLCIWLGNNVPEHTKAFVILVVIGSFFANLNSAVSGVVHSSGKMKLYQISGAIVNLCALPFMFMALFLGYSPEVALGISLFFQFLTQMSALIVLKTIVNYSIKSYFLKVILPLVIVISVSCIPPYILHTMIHESFHRFIIIMFFSFMEITFFTYLVGLSTQERNLIKSMAKSVLHVN